MSFKLTGILFILISGVCTAFAVKRSFDLRVEALLSFLLDFDFYINSVSYSKVRAGEITKEIIKTKKGNIKDFYKYMYEYFETGEESFLKSAFKEELDLKKEDKDILGAFFKCLGKTDYYSQLKELEFKKSCLFDCYEKAKENRDKKQKSGTMLTAGVFLVLIIVFL